jgi:BlaI family penicillinase repressor
MRLWNELSRRERQIMDVVYSRGDVTVSDVLEGLPDPPSYSAVRAMLRKLEEKGHLTHDVHGPRYVYRPTLPREKAQESALERVLDTFFEGSPGRAVQAILDSSAAELSDRELDDLAKLIEQARRRR